MRVTNYIKGILILFLLCCHSIFAATTDKVMMITGYIENNSTKGLKSSDLYFRHYDGYPAQGYVQMDDLTKKGRFLITMPVGQTTYILLDAGIFYAFDCKFKVVALDESHATITYLGTISPRPSDVCNFSGDPSNNTASLIINSK